ncbi:hypothetical protein HPB51_026533 [Rhipicephalus microplus]|uniref:Tick transposon n=1 Tax=Rhipicephalus microplus TaxID=6941 RepID=A0A9J6D2S6_RHIMP|nr:hypothetical protein HPB51_026533 [Rhipicephalus microplus]
MGGPPAEEDSKQQDQMTQRRVTLKRSSLSDRHWSGSTQRKHRDHSSSFPLLGADSSYKSPRPPTSSRVPTPATTPPGLPAGKLRGPAGSGTLVAVPVAQTRILTITGRSRNTTIWLWKCRGFARKRPVLQQFLVSRDRPEIIPLQEGGKHAQSAGCKTYTSGRANPQVATLVKRNMNIITNDIGSNLPDHHSTPRFALLGASIPWPKQVKYFGVVLDHRLRWQPAVTTQCRNTGRVACGNRCSPTLALRLFNGMASARILYGLPLASLSPSNWAQFDVVHLTAIRKYSSLPCFSRTGGRQRRPPRRGGRHAAVTACRPACSQSHRERASLATRSAARLPLSRSPALEEGPVCRTVPRPGAVHSGCERLRAPPCWHRPVTIRTSIPGVRSERATPVSALRQETTATLEDQLAGRLRVFTD